MAQLRLSRADSDTQVSVDYIRVYRGTPETLDRSLPNYLTASTGRHVSTPSSNSAT
jgi:hypothetical protein